jgi:tyrosine-specific transport protein
VFIYAIVMFALLLLIIRFEGIMSKTKKLIISMSLLMAGTALGAGILGLPIETGLSGFIPSLFGIVLSWITLMCTGWIFIYKILHSKYPVDDFADLYKKEFGHWSIWLNSFGYFITFYGVLTAYLCGMSTTIIKIFPKLEAVPHADKILIIIFFIVLTSVVLFGVNVFKKLNSLFAICLLIIFIGMVIFALSHIEIQNLQHVNLTAIPFTLPIIFTSFCFHPVIPLICNHVREENQTGHILKWILFWGTFIVFFVILVWSLIVLGIVPLNSSTGVSIIQANKENLPSTVPLAQSITSGLFPFFALLFTFFAIITSYIGAGAGFLSYVKNFSGHYIKRNRITDVVITFVIPFLVALFYPNIFLKMLGVVGGFGVIIIYGFLPALLAIKPGNNRGFKILGSVILIISLIIIVIELVQVLH